MLHAAWWSPQTTLYCGWPQGKNWAQSTFYLSLVKFTKYLVSSRQGVRFFALSLAILRVDHEYSPFINEETEAQKCEMAQSQ